MRPASGTQRSLTPVFGICCGGSAADWGTAGHDVEAPGGEVVFVTSVRPEEEIADAKEFGIVGKFRDRKFSEFRDRLNAAERSAKLKSKRVRKEVGTLMRSQPSRRARALLVMAFRSLPREGVVVSLIRSQASRPAGRAHPGAGVHLRRSNNDTTLHSLPGQRLMLVPYLTSHQER